MRTSWGSWSGVADRTGAYLAQLSLLLELSFTGELTLQCKQGQILDMGVFQRIRPLAADSSAPAALVLQQSSSAGLDSTVRRGIG